MGSPYLLWCISYYPRAIITLMNGLSIFSLSASDSDFFSAEEMLRTKDYFKNGQLDKEGLVKFIKDVKKNTKLSDEDAAVLAASKFVNFHLFSWLRSALQSVSQCKSFHLGLWTLSPILACGTGLGQCATWQVAGRPNQPLKWMRNSKRYYDLIYTYLIDIWKEKERNNSRYHTIY